MSLKQSALTTAAFEPWLKVDDLHTEFRGGRGSKSVVHAADGVSFSVYGGQMMALVGESGCGKSATAMSVLRLIPSPPGYITGGRIVYKGRNLLALSEKEMRQVRGGQIAMIFQEPMTSLNPVFTIGDQITEAILLHQKVGMSEAMDIAANAMTRVGIADAKRRLGEYPHQLSGGMKQRVMIAMALACQPAVLIADEPTTALDVTIQAQILELLQELKESTGMAVVLITHDLGIVAENADTVAIMYAGRIVEFADVYEIFDNPLHPYTQGLLSCVPRLGHEHERLVTIPGNVPEPHTWSNGCRFTDRCTVCTEEEKALCNAGLPELRQVAANHWVASYHAAGYATASAVPPASNFRRKAALSELKV
ncbi:MAG: ABC transporter ATP-binding protein [Phycisphaerales bacterium]|nr:ABC transporter ATP-binding protein [Phycisphaerales bacterium]